MMCFHKGEKSLQWWISAKFPSRSLGIFKLFKYQCCNLLQEKYMRSYYFSVLCFLVTLDTDLLGFFDLLDKYTLCSSRQANTFLCSLLNSSLSLWPLWTRNSLARFLPSISNSLELQFSTSSRLTWPPDTVTKSFKEATESGPASLYDFLLTDLGGACTAGRKPPCLVEYNSMASEGDNDERRVLSVIADMLEISVASLTTPGCACWRRRVTSHKTDESAPLTSGSSPSAWYICTFDAHIKNCRFTWWKWNTQYF